MTSGGSFSFDDGRVIRSANEPCVAALGRARAELIGAPLRAILPLATLVFFDAHLWPLLSLRGRVDDIYVSLLGADGRPIPVRLTATRTAREGGARTEVDFLVTPHRRPAERASDRAAPAPKGSTRAK